MNRPLCLLASLIATVQAAVVAAPRAEHVFVVSLDGGKPAVLKESEMPVLNKLVAEGAATWEARTIVPPKTLPSHTSMLTGVGPDKHQVLWNAFEPIRGPVKVPTIFSLLREKEPAAVTAMFVGKVKFRHLWQRDSLELFNYGGPQQPGPVAGTEELEKAKVPSLEVASQTAAWLKEHQPRLAFIHLTDGDTAGHAYGWGSPVQKDAFHITDQALGQVVDAIQAAGIADSSVIIISADHGGHGQTHGEDIPDDMLIPWVAWGKGVKKGLSIAAPVTTFDTAATALWLLDVPVPASFDGKPVASAFEP